MSIKSPLFIIGIIQGELSQLTLQIKYKMNLADFTRKRKQSFYQTLLFMINRSTKSLSLEILNFHNFISSLQIFDCQLFTKSAYSQYRKKISPDVFKHLSSVLIREFYTDNDSVKRWLGYRILAIDGSNIELPFNSDLEAIYGRVTNQSNTYVIQAKVSVMYDVLNRFAIDTSLTHTNTGERSMALEHLVHCTERDLVIYDRGYPSYDFIYEHIQRNIFFIIRASLVFNKQVIEFVKSNKPMKIIEMYPTKKHDFQGKSYNKNTPLKVKLIKIVLSTGITEVLITNLQDENIDIKLYKELYFKRWGIETFYDELKNKLKVELFSGYSNQIILQDFYSAILVSNLQSLIVGEINDEIFAENRTTKYEYKVNNSLSYGVMKNRVIEMILSPNLEEKLLELKKLIRENVIPIRPNRSSIRPKRKYDRIRRKPKVTKNQRDNF